MINTVLKVLFLFVIFLKSGVSEHQTFYYLATGKEPVLIENSDFTKLDEATSKAVVDINAEGIKNIYINLPQFQKYYQIVDPQTGKQLKEVSKSSGSAVIISEDGYLITCGHIVSPGSKITVKLSDYRKYTAKIVANYPEIDLAILKIDDLKGTKLPYLKLGSSDTLKRGAFVAAIGNALNLNLGKTFTDGHISATRRRLNISTLGSSFVVLQHNVAVNPGNSGGALVDNRGNLVGINNAMLSNASSIGFSIPINIIRGYLDKFFKKIDGSTFGLFDVSPISDNAIDRLHETGFSYPGGLLISKVKEKTPAAEGGLKAGDIIVSVGEMLTEMPEDLRIFENITNPAKKVDFLVWRDKKIIKLTINPIKHTKDMLIERVKIRGNHPLSGIEVVALTPELAEKIRMPSDTKGLLVLNDLRGGDGIAALTLFGGSSFLQKGDLLTKVNDHKLVKPRDLTEALKVSSTKRTLSVHLWRKGQEIQFSIDGLGMSDVTGGKQKNEQNPPAATPRRGMGMEPNMHELMRRQLQDLFGGNLVEKGLTRQFSPGTDRLPDRKEDMINEALKHVPAQMA